MMHDPAEYPDPVCFKPQRFLKDGKLNPDVKNPNEIAFGFGRRWATPDGVTRAVNL